VFEDLKPYVCTFQACETELFAGEHTWFSHELQTHRTRWKCYFCLDEFFLTPDKYRGHLKLRHENVYNTGSLLPALIEMSQQPILEFFPSDCPFCDDWESRLRKSSQNEKAGEKLLIDVEQFKGHVGAHMRQLALLAEPRHHSYSNLMNVTEDADDISRSSEKVVSSTVDISQIRRKKNLSGVSIKMEKTTSANVAPPSTQLISESKPEISDTMINGRSTIEIDVKSNELSNDCGFFEYHTDVIPSSETQVHLISGKTPVEEPQSQAADYPVVTAQQDVSLKDNSGIDEPKKQGTDASYYC
jgi:hypothetical protein